LSRLRSSYVRRQSSRLQRWSRNNKFDRSARLAACPRKPSPTNNAF
jgi:hypothetical protein